MWQAGHSEPTTLPELRTGSCWQAAVWTPAVAMPPILNWELEIRLYLNILILEIVPLCSFQRFYCFILTILLVCPHFVARRTFNLSLCFPVLDGLLTHSLCRQPGMALKIQPFFYLGHFTNLSRNPLISSRNIYLVITIYQTLLWYLNITLGDIFWWGKIRPQAQN